jgi:hypothetical protein
MGNSIERNLKQIENNSTSKLFNLYYHNIAPHQYAALPIEWIKGRKQRIVKEKIRQLTSESYFAGIKTIQNHIWKYVPDHPVYPTGRDISNIARLSEKAEEQFWYWSEQLGKPERDKLDTLKTMGRIAVTTTYGPYNEAMRSKYANSLGLGLVVRQGQGQEQEETTRSGAIEESLLLTALAGLNLFNQFKKPKVAWQTAEDSLVCHTGVEPWNCKPMNGREWEVDDPDIPELPAHDFCRCIFVPVEDTSIDWASILNLSALAILAGTAEDRNRR